MINIFEELIIRAYLGRGFIGRSRLDQKDKPLLIIDGYGVEDHGIIDKLIRERLVSRGSDSYFPLTDKGIQHAKDLIAAGYNISK